MGRADGAEAAERLGGGAEATGRVWCVGGEGGEVR